MKIQTAIAFLLLLTIVLSACTGVTAPPETDSTTVPSESWETSPESDDTSADTPDTNPVAEITAKQLIDASDAYEDSFTSYKLSVRSDSSVTVMDQTISTQILFNQTETEDSYSLYIYDNSLGSVTEKSYAYLNGAGYYANNGVNFKQNSIDKAEFISACLGDTIATDAFASLVQNGEVSQTDNLYSISAGPENIEDRAALLEALSAYDISPSVELTDCDLTALFNDVGFLDTLVFNVNLDARINGQIIPVAINMQFMASISDQGASGVYDINIDYDNAAETEALLLLMQVADKKSEWDNIYRGANEFFIQSSVVIDDGAGRSLDMQTNDRLAIDYSYDEGTLTSRNRSVIVTGNTETLRDSYYRDGTFYVIAGETIQSQPVDAASMIAQYVPSLTSGYHEPKWYSAFSAEQTDGKTVCTGILGDYYADELMKSMITVYFGDDIGYSEHTTVFNNSPYAKTVIDSDGNIEAVEWCIDGKLTVADTRYDIYCIYRVTVTARGHADTSIPGV